MPTVLVVEDDSTLRASIVRGLSELRGVAVLAAGTVREARALIGANVPQLVITELSLPDEPGVAVIHELDRVGANTPVIVASAALRQHKLPRRPGVVAVEKPYSLSALRELVVEQLGLEDVNAAFTLTDFVTLAGMGRHSVRLEVSLAGAALGEVVILRGEAWHARNKKGVGPEAFFRLCGLQGAALRVQPAATDGPRSLQGTCEAMLLEYFRWQDLHGDAPATTPIESDRPRLTLPYGGLSQLQEGDERWFAELTRAATEKSAASSSSPRAPPSAPAPTAHKVITPTPVLPTEAPNFEELYSKGVEALLDRRYREALDAFEAAARVGTSPSLQANLSRLRAMGIGS